MNQNGSGRGVDIKAQEPSPTAQLCTKYNICISSESNWKESEKDNTLSFGQVLFGINDDLIILHALMPLWI